VLADEGARWDSFDLQAHHNAYYNTTHPEWLYSTPAAHHPAGQAPHPDISVTTAYTSLATLPDGRIVIAYDHMPWGQPHSKPPTPEQGKDVRFQSPRDIGF
jgi:hypothetical protein